MKDVSDIRTAATADERIAYLERSKEPLLVKKRALEEKIEVLQVRQRRGAGGVGQEGEGEGIVGKGE